MNTYLILGQINRDDGGLRKSEWGKKSLYLLLSSTIHQVTDIYSTFHLIKGQKVSKRPRIAIIRTRNDKQDSRSSFNAIPFVHLLHEISSVFYEEGEDHQPQPTCVPYPPSLEPPR